MKINEVMKRYGQETILYKLLHLPINKWVSFTNFLLSLPDRKKNSRDEYFTFYYQILAYSYCTCKMQDSILVMDHGLVQQLGSILHNQDFNITDKSLRRFSKFLHSMQPLRIVYCRLSEEDALGRMRERKRDTGRIDAVMNDTDHAMSLLKKERKLFDKCYHSNKETIDVLDMSKTREDLLRDVSANLIET